MLTSSQKEWQTVKFPPRRKDNKLERKNSIPMTNLENQDHSHAKDEITALNNQSPTSDPPRKDVSTTPSSKVQY